MTNKFFQISENKFIDFNEVIEVGWFNRGEDNSQFHTYIKLKNGKVEDFIPLWEIRENSIWGEYIDMIMNLALTYIHNKNSPIMQKELLNFIKDLLPPEPFFAEISTEESTKKIIVHDFS